MTTHHSKQHKTKWTVTNLRTGSRLTFNSQQGAREYTLAYGGNLVVRPPLYG